MQIARHGKRRGEWASLNRQFPEPFMSRCLTFAVAPKGGG